MVTVVPGRRGRALPIREGSLCTDSLTSDIDLSSWLFLGLSPGVGPEYPGPGRSGRTGQEEATGEKRRPWLSGAFSS